ncbi:MAG: hypothetical protein QUS07_07205 [Methanothrix sp.]|nr:hypothetical protein [Methanothrix sp.]
MSHEVRSRYFSKNILLTVETPQEVKSLIDFDCLKIPADMTISID